VFLGTHAPLLDGKGRLVLPAKFRDALSGGLVLSKGQDRSVVVWPAAEFGDYAARIREASRTDARARAYSRVLFSAASDQVPDKQGRISIPSSLRDYAGLERECIVVGNHDTLEIWNPGSWQTYLSAQDPAFAELAEEVVPGVF
jgi:MraZ protein